MPISLQAASTDEHFAQILQLQRRNHASAVDPHVQATEGFVFAQHTADILRQMATHLPQVIALCDDRVVGYNLAMPVAMRDAVPSLVPMFAQFERSQYRGTALTDYRYFVGGQVCVDKPFRGQGLIGRLYRETRQLAPRDQQLCITEVAARNVISLNAHYKIGFEDIAVYHDSAEQWHVVAWDLRNDD